MLLANSDALPRGWWSFAAPVVVLCRASAALPRRSLHEPPKPGARATSGAARLHSRGKARPCARQSTTWNPHHPPHAPRPLPQFANSIRGGAHDGGLMWAGFEKGALNGDRSPQGGRLQSGPGRRRPATPNGAPLGCRPRRRDTGIPARPDPGGNSRSRRGRVGRTGIPLAGPRALRGLPGRPTLSGHRMGSDWSPSFALTGLEHSGDDRVTVHGVDPVARLGLRSEIELSPSGLLRLRHTLRNEGDSPYVVNELLCALTLPGQATELLDLSGRWCRERHPQRHPLELGSWVRENRRGRTGHDATIGLVAGTPGFGFRHGEVWAVHVGWSGNHVSYAGRWPSGDAVLGGGELLLPGEVSLAPAEEYATPWLYAAYSPHGLDGIAA